MAPQFEQHDIGTPKPTAQTQACDLVSLAKFEKRYGVDVNEQNGKLTYKLHGGSQQDILDFSTSPTIAGLSQAGSILSQRVIEKEAELAAKFHVQFSQDGEDAEHQLVRDKDSKYVAGELIHARAPKLNELTGIEAALNRSRPSQLRNGDSDNGVKFYFLTSKYVSDEKSVAHFDQSDLQKQPAILVEPERLQEFPIRQADAIQQRRPADKTMEAYITHELVHNGQHNLGWSTIDKLASDFGWVNSSAGGWLVRGKDQTYYALDPKFPVSRPYWYLANESGEPVDAKHQPLKAGQRSYVPNAQVRTNALVHPLTNYFIDPYEMMADELTLFRMGNANRANIAKSDCTSYGLLKSLDQSEIDKASGPGEHYIRDWNGQLVEANPENEAALQKQELKFNCRQ
jgi:hypothetical protein